METLNNIINMLLIPILPSLAILLGLYINKLIKKAQEDLEVAQGTQMAIRLDEATQAVIDAIQNTTQTYVWYMKDNDAFDVQAQKEALRLTIETAKLLMSDIAKETITKVSGDVDVWVKTIIESKIAELKPLPYIERVVVDDCDDEGNEVY